MFSLKGVSVKTTIIVLKASFPRLSGEMRGLEYKDTEHNVIMVALVYFGKQIALSFYTHRPWRKRFEIVKLKHYK